jgi:hypothetical protein
MQAAQREAQVGVVEIVCALAALGATAASLMWDATSSGIIALIMVTVMYAALRDLRMLWHTGKSGIQPASPEEVASVPLQRFDGTNERPRTTTE